MGCLARKRRSVRLAAAVALTAGLPLAAPGAAVLAGTAAKPAPPASSLAPPTAIMRAQIPLVRAADKIAAAAKGRSGYTDITLSVRQHLVRVYWKLPLPGPVSRLIGQLRSPGVRIQVLAAPYTARQLNAEVLRLEFGRSRYAARGVLLNRLVIRPDGTGIDVGTARSSAPQAAASAALAGLRASTTIPLHFQPALAIHPASGRLADTPPFWAGDRIFNALGWSCTTGFPMRRRSDGRTFITTADHCDAPSHPVNEEWTTWSGGNRVGEAWYHVPSLDIAYIRPPNGAVAGGVYLGGIAPADQLDGSVKGVGNNYPGLNVCTDGSYTVEVCGIQTLDQESDWIQDDNSWVTLWRGTAGAGCECVAMGDGDSGGPILTYGDGGVLANGSLTGSNSGYGLQWVCFNDYNEAIFYCFNYVYWVDEQSILNWLGASLLTS